MDVQAYTKTAGLNVETRDISLSGRIISSFNDILPADQQVADALAELGDLAKTPEANIIKLPNISASVPQMNACIAELQAKGYALPCYPEVATTDAEVDAKARYDKVKGSAVNPVLREGNSDRRAPPAVKAYARANPHRMGKWSPDSKAHVSTMGAGDFFSNEQSVTVPAATEVAIEFTGADGSTTVMASGVALLAGEIIDSTFMSTKALVAFLEEQVADAREQDILFSGMRPSVRAVHACVYIGAPCTLVRVHWYGSASARRLPTLYVSCVQGMPGHLHARFLRGGAMVYVPQRQHTRTSMCVCVCVYVCVCVCVSLSLCVCVCMAYTRTS